MNVLIGLVLANLCASPVYDREERCIQFLMTKENCAALMRRQHDKSLKPFVVQCYPVTEKRE